MPKKESPLSALDAYLPTGAYEGVAHYLQQYKVHLTITRERQTILGNYRNRHRDMNHRITVNGNLNPYSFLITLLHELAHLLTYEQYGNRIAAHGKEWKDAYGGILAEFIPKKIFPPDLEKVLLQGLHNPAATSCAEPQLVRALKKYDAGNAYRFLEELPAGSLFRIKSGNVYRKGDRVRTRYKCEEQGSGRVYLFSPVYEVELFSGERT